MTTTFAQMVHTQSGAMNEAQQCSFAYVAAPKQHEYWLISFCFFFFLLVFFWYIDTKKNIHSELFLYPQLYNDSFYPLGASHRPFQTTYVNAQRNRVRTQCTNISILKSPRILQNSDPPPKKNNNNNSHARQSVIH